MLQQPSIHILMATYNGGRYLDEQLQSIARQTYSNWTLSVSDDGSTDNTLAIVQSFAMQVSQPVSIMQGPREGSSTSNFYHLMAIAPAGNTQDLYAFCDQDDVWHNDKLQRALLWHSQHLNQTVRLYCCRTQFVNEELRLIGLSPCINRPPSFGNALVQNIASGNTMVFSHALLMAQRSVLPVHSVWHDWTTYVVATGLGGLVYFDSAPCLLYRQHRSNLIGANNGFRAALRHVRPIIEGRYKHWLNLNDLSINDIFKNLTINSQNIYLQFQMMRNSSTIIARLKAYANSDIRRQSFMSNVLLVIYLIFGAN
jgi:glycosyltransferase involved in cell wall biosynthesis